MTPLWFNQIPGLAEKVQFAIAAVASGKIFREDIAYSWADGSEHFTNFILLPVKDETGRGAASPACRFIPAARQKCGSRNFSWS